MDVAAFRHLLHGVSQRDESVRVHSEAEINRLANDDFVLFVQLNLANILEQPDHTAPVSISLLERVSDSAALFSTFDFFKGIWETILMTFRVAYRSSSLSLSHKFDLSSIVARLCVSYAKRSGTAELVSSIFAFFSESADLEPFFLKVLADVLFASGHTAGFSPEMITCVALVAPLHPDSVVPHVQLFFEAARTFPENSELQKAWPGLLAAIPPTALQATIRTIDAFLCDSAAFFLPQIGFLIEFLSSIGASASLDNVTRNLAMFCLPSLAASLPVIFESEDSLKVIEMLIGVATEFTEELPWDSDPNDSSPSRTALEALSQIASISSVQWWRGRVLVSALFDVQPRWQVVRACLCAMTELLQDVWDFWRQRSRSEYDAFLKSFSRLLTEAPQAPIRHAAWRFCAASGRHWDSLDSEAALTLLVHAGRWALSTELDQRVRAAAATALSAICCGMRENSRTLTPLENIILELQALAAEFIPVWPELARDLGFAIAGCQRVLRDCAGARVFLAALQHQVSALPVLSLPLIWFEAYAMHYRRTEKGPVSVERIAGFFHFAWVLLEHCETANEIEYCRQAIEMLAERLAPHLPALYLPRFVDPVFVLASGEIRVEQFSRFDALLVVRGLYDEIPSVTPGVRHFVLASEVKSVNFGLATLTHFASGMGFHFLPCAERAAALVAHWLSAPFRIPSVQRYSFALLTALIRITKFPGHLIELAAHIFEVHPTTEAVISGMHDVVIAYSGLAGRDPMVFAPLIARCGVEMVRAHDTGAANRAAEIAAWGTLAGSIAELYAEAAEAAIADGVLDVVRPLLESLESAEAAVLFLRPFYARGGPAFPGFYEFVNAMLHVASAVPSAAFTCFDSFHSIAETWSFAPDAVAAVLEFFDTYSVLLADETSDDENMFAAASALAVMIDKFPDQFGENINDAIVIWACLLTISMSDINAVKNMITFTLRLIERNCDIVFDARVACRWFPFIVRAFQYEAIRLSDQYEAFRQFLDECDQERAERLIEILIDEVPPEQRTLFRDAMF
jgi:hypothetical protein